MRALRCIWACVRGEQIAGHMGVSACRGSSLLALLVMAAFAAPRSSTLVLRGASRAARLGNDMPPEIWRTASLPHFSFGTPGSVI